MVTSAERGRRETCEMTQVLAKVGTLTGDIEELALTADTESVLRNELQNKGYHVFWVRKSFGLGALRNPFSARERITHTEFLPRF